MMPDDFRRLALALEGAEERVHMHHPDFRVGGRIFATLGYPDAAWGMVKLNPEQQNDLVHAQPAVFSPVNGAWGRQGCTRVALSAATAAVLGPAIRMAWENARAARPKPKATASSRGTARPRGSKARTRSRG